MATFIQTAYKFLEYLKVIKNASEHTIRNYTIDLNAFKSFLEEDLNLPSEKIPAKIQYDTPWSNRDSLYDDLIALDSVSRKTIRQFLAKLNALETNKRTIARRLSSLRSFFKYAYSQKMMSVNPIEDLEAPKLDKTVPISLAYEQVKRLFEQPDCQSYLGFRDRTIMELFYSSGLRVSELVALDRADFDPENFLVKLKGKGKKILHFCYHCYSCCYCKHFT
jgi:integrase/recombinase XerC